MVCDWRLGLFFLEWRLMVEGLEFRVCGYDQSRTHRRGILCRFLFPMRKAARRRPERPNPKP